MALALRLILDRICEPNGVVQSPVNGPSLIPDPGSLGSHKVPAPKSLSSHASLLSENEGAKTDISNH
jgi:hypothetical protein